MRGVTRDQHPARHSVECVLVNGTVLHNLAHFEKSLETWNGHLEDKARACEYVFSTNKVPELFDMPRENSTKLRGQSE